MSIMAFLTSDRLELSSSPVIVWIALRAATLPLSISDIGNLTSRVERFTDMSWTRTTSRWALMLLLGGLTLGVAAQVTPGGSTRNVVSPDELTGDKLGPGDQILISIADLEEVKNLSVRIAADGTLDLPLVGIVHASGRSVAALRMDLTALYERYITKPQVSLQVTTSQTRTVSVLGEVNTPGVQEITGPLSLLAAISKAGGVRPDAGPQVIVTRPARSGQIPAVGSTVTTEGGYSRAVFPLDDLIAAKIPANNIPLQAGDVITVPKGALIYVIGAVHRSGGFPLRSSGNLSIVEALSLAEGLGPNAKSGSAKILRRVGPSSEQRKEIAVDIGKVLAGKEPDQQMTADDILFVPSSSAKAGFRRAAEAVLQVSTGVLIYR